jgi:hypothetical protein
MHQKFSVLCLRRLSFHKISQQGMVHQSFRNVRSSFDVSLTDCIIHSCIYDTANNKFIIEKQEVTYEARCCKYRSTSALAALTPPQDQEGVGLTPHTLF